MASDGEELPPSRLGTKEHWDMVYERENRVFKDVGDEGEVWFGEDAVCKMRQWAADNLPHQDTPIRVLECGSGNGTLLLSFLTSPGPDVEPQAFHLTGIDYSEGAVALGASIEAARRETLEDDMDVDDVINPVTCEWRHGDLLRDDIAETWDLVMDKGTFDALALSRDPVEGTGGQLPSRVYPQRIARLVKPGGFFLITSCNFTEEEIKSRYTKPELGFTFHSSVPHRSFSFGGKTGTTVCTVAFQKTGTTATANGTAATANGTTVTTNGTAPAANGADPMYISIDCGGTKTEIVIATKAGIQARAVGGTGNMAEVGLQKSFETIVETTLAALAEVGITTSDRTTCPVDFADTWVGISGCDTALDQKRMSALLSPFFNQPVKVHNDALLLGGALLSQDSPWGIAVICGTGSVVVGLEVVNGEVVQAARRGGHGYLLGDDGSAYDIGRCAIRCAVHDCDGGVEVEGGLAAKLREHFGCNETGELLAKVHELDPALTPVQATNAQKLRISNASIHVMQAFTASPPDPLAARAIADALRPLAESVVYLAKQLLPRRLPDGSERTLKNATLVAGGGVIRQDAYRALFLEACAKEGVVFGNVQVVDDVGGKAVLGLVDRARRAAN